MLERIAPATVFKCLADETRARMTLLIAAEGERSVLRRALGQDWKGKLSPVLYLAGIVASFWQAGAALAFYVGVALLWLVPDRRIEKTLR